MSFLKNRKQFINLYDERTYTIAKNVEKLHQKLMKINQHIDFLKKCKKAGVIPNGMRINNTTCVGKNTHLIYTTMIKIRNNTLEWKYKQNKLLLIEIATQESILNIYMKKAHPHRDHAYDLNWMNKHDNKKKDFIIKKHLKKFINAN